MNKRPAQTIDMLFKKIRSKNTQLNTPGPSAEITTVEFSQSQSSIDSQSSKSQESADCLSSEQKAAIHNEELVGSSIFDIGTYCSKEFISETDKYNLLKNSFSPGNNFEYPFSIHKKNDKEIRCFLSAKHFDLFKWLTYSEKYNGVFCKFCFLFAKYGGVNKSTSLNKLVINPLCKFSKLLGKTGDLMVHDSSKYHREAVEAADNFLKTYENPEKEIINILDAKRASQIRENREKLRPIIESILFLGRQNIPLRGHRDYGRIMPNTLSEINEGNFREILRFRANSGDQTLKNHLETSSSTSMYISNTIQNQIIEICGLEILDKIVTKIKKSKFYSIVFDETTDISHKSQMTLVIRYLENKEIKEDFVGFLDCFSQLDDSDSEVASQCLHTEQKLTGKVLAELVLVMLKKYGLSLSNCVGIGTDTCSVMLSDQKGAVAELQKYLPQAIKSPCLSHSLNLSISKSNNVQDIRNCVGIMKETIHFFNASPKRFSVLLNTGDQRLKKLCETRWTERHESVLRFKNNIEHVVNALQIISTWKDLQTSSKAQSLISSLVNTNFIISLYCLSHLLAITQNLSAILQEKTLDKFRAKTLITDVLSVLKETRKNADTAFQKLFLDINECHHALDISVLIPRRAARQINRCNVETNDPEVYYRISIFIPLLDNIIEDIEFRFDDERVSNIFHLNVLVPSLTVNTSNEDIILMLKDLSTYLENVFDEKKNFYF